MSIAGEMERIDTALDAVENGKTAIAEAITAKGVDTLPGATFDTMAVNIGLIEGSGTAYGYPDSMKSFFEWLRDSAQWAWHGTFSVQSNGTDVVMTHNLGYVPTSMLCYAEISEQEKLGQLAGKGYVMSIVTNSYWGQDKVEDRTWVYNNAQNTIASLSPIRQNSIIDIIRNLDVTVYNATAISENPSETVVIRNGTNTSNKLIVGKTYHVYLS